ncbi:MAG TPA: sensor histidine kinase [Acidimicrobiales bacterium]|jgi:two-component system sensor histidine kinase DesK|nr:sensor histidine kinase [Acidimicrobiales bacterium]
MATNRPWERGPGPASTEWDRNRQQWARGWRRYLFPGVFLLYLGQAVAGISKHSSGLAAAAGYAVLVAYCVCYLVALPASWGGDRRRFWTMYGAMVALTTAELFVAHEDALVMVVFIAVLTLGGFRRYAVPVIGAFTVVALFLPPLVPSWHTGIDTNAGFSVPMVALAMYGFFSIVRANRALSEARAEIARLAAENERSRIARDLHDLLGHSLTSITLKAGLARRLAERDPDRAAEEIADVEELARKSLTDVRAAVGGYREVTLAGELATSREVLRASGITAELPPATDVVDPANQELFGWVVREGVTNTVRHSRATRCTVTFGPDWIELVDDGRGGAGGGADAGHGLSGLRERVAAAGGTVRVGTGAAGGWRLRVDVPAVPAKPAGRPVAGPPVSA